MRVRRALLVSAVMTLSCGGGQLQSVVPARVAAGAKYGKVAYPLSRNHGYLKTAEAPDFWALMPYYLPQRSEATCAAATAAMIINAGRAGWPLNSETRLATEASVLALPGVLWNDGHGLTLDEFRQSLAETLRLYGVNAKVLSVHARPGGSADFVETLQRNEASASDLVIANFVQGQVLDDTGGGHFAPIGAYDAATGLALLMDPDREWYEPYWTPAARLYEAMLAIDPISGLTRGYLVVRVEDR